VPQLVAAGLLPDAKVRSAIGTIEPGQSIDLQRTYLRTYFDAALGNDNVSDALGRLVYPEIVAHR
jgi:hypothetical protein